jgi:chromosome segregation ATPase
MRLLGRSAAPPSAEEEPLQEEEATGARPAYEELGQRVTNILNAAEESAAAIRTEAQQEAATMRREAQEEAAAASREAARRRQEAEQEAKKKISDAETNARAMREAAERAAREMEVEMNRRRDELREEVRSIEEQRQRALLELRDIVADLQSVLLEGPAHVTETHEGGSPADDTPGRRQGRDAEPSMRRVERSADGGEGALDAERG